MELLKRILYSLGWLLLSLCFWSPLSYGYDTYEHRYIADQAFERAISQVQLSRKADTDLKASVRLLFVGENARETGANPISDGNYIKQIPLSFGDLASFGGDFSESPEELLDLIRHIQNTVSTITKKSPSPDIRFLVTRRQWANVCGWLKETKAHNPQNNSTKPTKLNDCVHEFLRSEDSSLLFDLRNEKVQVDQPIATAGYVSPRSEIAEFEKLKDYASLASNNRSHFPTNSWKEYVVRHAQALNFARCYRSPVAGCSVYRREALTKALVYEGFAQHFLHDSLASGHIGTPFTDCLTANRWYEIPYLKRAPVLCFPTKDYVQNLHDALNHIGLRVHVNSSPQFNSLQESNVSSYLSSKLEKGWTAFGDRSLFILEAAFHRFVVINYATQSLNELLQNLIVETSECALCDATLFPVPEDVEGLEVDIADSEYKVKSLGNEHFDERVRDPQLEGWKFQVAYGNLAVTRPPSNEFPGGVQSAVAATTFEMGYVRSTIWYVPNYLGFGVLYSPSLVSVYPLSIGYWFNPVEALARALQLKSHQAEGFPLTVGFRLNVGVQTAEPSTKFNPSPSRSTLGEVTGVFDVRLQLYGPISGYARMEFVRAVGSGNIPWQIDSGFTGGTIGTLFGISFDLAGIL